MAQRQGKGLGRGAADALLAVIACAWGSSYLLMKVGTGAVPPFSLIALRFGIAFVVVAAIFSRRLAKTRVSTLVRAAVLGALMFALFGFLMTGIVQTSASNAGFLTSLAVVFVPVINAVVRRRAPGARMTAGVAVTLLGIALLSLHGSLTLSPGDALCVMGSIFYALFIVATDPSLRQGGPAAAGRVAAGIRGALWPGGHEPYSRRPRCPPTPSTGAPCWGLRSCAARLASWPSPWPSAPPRPSTPRCSLRSSPCRAPSSRSSSWARRSTPAACWAPFSSLRACLWRRCPRAVAAPSARVPRRACAPKRRQDSQKTACKGSPPYRLFMLAS